MLRLSSCGTGDLVVQRHAGSSLTRDKTCVRGIGSWTYPRSHQGSPLQGFDTYFSYFDFFFFPSFFISPHFAINALCLVHKLPPSERGLNSLGIH